LLHSIKPAGWPAQLAHSTFNGLDQYASSPDYRAYFNAKLADYSLAVAKTIASTQSLRIRDGQAELA